MRARVVVEEPTGCPLVELGDDADTVSVMSYAGDTGEAFVEGDSENGELFEYAEGSVVRYTRPSDCVCGRIESVGIPVAKRRVRNEKLELVFHASDPEQLRTALTRLRDSADVWLRQLIESEWVLDPTEVSTVDLRALTDRQTEVLRTAHEAGHFDRPRTASVGDLAAELNVSSSTVTQHLDAALRKMLDQIVG